jgi:hypothetical protein
VVGKYIFESEIGKSNLHEISNENEARTVNFAIFKNRHFENKIFPDCKFHIFIWKYHNGEIRSQIDHILIDRRRHSTVLDYRFSRAADYDIEHNVIVAEFSDRLGKKERETQKSDIWYLTSRSEMM